MTKWLVPQEAIAQFLTYLDWVFAKDLMPDEGSEHDNNDVNGNNEALPTTSASPTKHCISVKPGFPHTDVPTITTAFKAPKFIPALTNFICRAIPPPKTPLLPEVIDRFDLYKVLSIHTSDLPAVDCRNNVQRIRATPVIPGPGGRKDTPAHFDTVLVWTERDKEKMVTKGTCLEGKQTMPISTLSPHKKN
jgi:hypothetical protein